MNRTHAFIAITSLCLSYSIAPASEAQTTLTDQGHTVGPQCSAAGIDNSDEDVGSCTTLSGSGPETAFFGSPTSTTTLGPLQTGQNCRANGITNSHVAIGSCSSISGSTEGVVWSISSPSLPQALAPLSATLLVLQFNDANSLPTAFNQQGDVVGLSASGHAHGTAVIWPAQSLSSTPRAAVLVSVPHDNCAPADVAANATLPDVVLNCPSQTAGIVARYAKASGSSYVMSDLPLPSGFNACSVSGITSGLGVAGTCQVLNGKSAAVYWPNYQSAPIVLSVPGVLNTAAAAVNSLGHMLVTYEDSNGKSESAFWTAADAAPTFTPIPQLSGGTQTAAADLARTADVVAVNARDSAQNVEGGIWKPGQTTLTPVGFESGAAVSSVAALSENGSYGAANALSASGQQGSAEFNVP